MKRKIFPIYIFKIVMIELLIHHNLLIGQISASKHNLSVSGTGTIKATAEQEICKFCHIPHKATISQPLWDHTLSSVSYSQYTSSTFSATYVAQFPKTSSKLCLSCHDGTIAVGSISIGQINVTGGALLDANQRLVATSTSNIGGIAGTNLSDDHPVSIGIPHFNSSQYNCNGCHNTHTGVTSSVECTSCHDPHQENIDATVKKFLKMNNSASALCLTCHNKTYWATNPAVHQSSTKTMPTGLSHTGYTTVATNACESCHKSHSATNASRLTKGVEQGTCDPCHKGTMNGGITAKNVSNITGGPFAKLYGHPTYTVDGKHTPVNANPVTNSTTEASSNVSSPNRHAECVDCHNQHAATSGLHTVKSNAVSNVLNGAWGLEPSAVAKWTQPTLFTRIDPVTKEYQICMKCHSNYGLGVATNGVSTILGPSGSNITDQAMEYNVNNGSVHPVLFGLANQTGSYAPKSLVAAQMTTVWNTVGTQAMYCSDCHGNDQATSATVPQGPHGSNYKFMLTGTAKYWPATAAGKLWSLDDVKNNLNSWATNLFCANCHPLFSGGTWKNNVHSRGDHELPTVYCISCHVVVPHGSKRSRLIGYTTDPSPYNYNGAGTTDKLILSGFKKSTTGPNGYDIPNCYTTLSGCADHSANAGGYDQ